MYDFRWHEQLIGWLASLTLEDKVRQDLSLPWMVCEYEDVFLDELQGLPPHRVVDFCKTREIPISGIRAKS